ncbi:hypothetical protein Bbelb_136640 [Branchiostoma belcheri]|nr:hypothetical protein Bbelb_136640 [Branchiostoma belcheri]
MESIRNRRKTLSRTLSNICLEMLATRNQDHASQAGREKIRKAEIPHVVRMREIREDRRSHMDMDDGAVPTPSCWAGPPEDWSRVVPHAGKDSPFIHMGRVISEQSPLSERGSGRDD